MSCPSSPAQPISLSVRADTSALEAEVRELAAKVEAVLQLLRQGPATAASYTPAEVADLLKCDRDKVYELIRTKRLPAVRVGERNLRIPARALQAFLDGDIPREIPRRREPLQLPKRGRSR